jgi:hypothetical protein
MPITFEVAPESRLTVSYDGESQKFASKPTFLCKYSKDATKKTMIAFDKSFATVKNVEYPITVEAEDGADVSVFAQFEEFPVYVETSENIVDKKSAKATNYCFSRTQLCPPSFMQIFYNNEETYDIQEAENISIIVQESDANIMPHINAIKGSNVKLISNPFSKEEQNYVSIKNIDIKGTADFGNLIVSAPSVKADEVIVSLTSFSSVSMTSVNTIKVTGAIKNVVVSEKETTVDTLSVATEKLALVSSSADSLKLDYAGAKASKLNSIPSIEAKNLVIGGRWYDLEPTCEKTSKITAIKSDGLAVLQSEYHSMPSFLENAGFRTFFNDANKICVYTDSEDVCAPYENTRRVKYVADAYIPIRSVDGSACEVVVFGDGVTITPECNKLNITSIGTSCAFAAGTQSIEELTINMSTVLRVCGQTVGACTIISGAVESTDARIKTLRGPIDSVMQSVKSCGTTDGSSVTLIVTGFNALFFSSGSVKVNNYDIYECSSKFKAITLEASGVLYIKGESGASINEFPIITAADGSLRVRPLISLYDCNVVGSDKSIYIDGNGVIIETPFNKLPSFISYNSSSVSVEYGGEEYVPSKPTPLPVSPTATEENQGMTEISIDKLQQKSIILIALICVTCILLIVVIVLIIIVFRKKKTYSVNEELSQSLISDQNII